MAALFIPPTPSPSVTLTNSIPLLTSISPLLDHRITSPIPPPNFPAHISSYLLSLTDSDLSQCHSVGIGPYFETHAPPPLSSLAASIQSLCQSFPTLSVLPKPSGQSRRRSKTRPRPAKRAQIRALVTVVDQVLDQSTVPVKRVVDLGAGHGHLAAHLAEHLTNRQIHVHAVEQDELLVDTARALHGELTRRLTMEKAMVRVGTKYVGREDLVIGLHACGGLGDAVVQLAAERRAAAVVLVSCCLQKIRGEKREPLSRVVRETEELDKVLRVGRGVLGVTNRAKGEGNDGDLRARETRYALRQLLRDRGAEVERIGDEVEGVSRHRLRRGLRAVAGEVLERRGLEKFGEEELDWRTTDARLGYAKMRRLTLPRLLAGEALEMALVLDRAALLEEAGFKWVSTCRIWGDDVSVRNLCCIAWR